MTPIGLALRVSYRRQKTMTVFSFSSLVSFAYSFILMSGTCLLLFLSVLHQCTSVAVDHLKETFLYFEFSTHETALHQSIHAFFIPNLSPFCFLCKVNPTHHLKKSNMSPPPCLVP